MNSVKLRGRLAQEPEVRYTKTNKAVASFSVAVSRGPAKEGQKESADFVPIVVWGKLAEQIGNTLSKGNEVFIEGRMQIRSYETTDGQKRRVTEVVANFVATSIMNDAEKPKGSNKVASNNGQKADFGSLGHDVTDDEEIPF